MSTRNANSGLTLTGRIDRKVYDTGDLLQQHDGWREMDDTERLEATRLTDPIDQETVYNVTVDRFHQYFVDNLDPSQTGADANVEPTWLGLGDDAASGTSTTDTDLNNRLFEKQVTDHTDNGKELLASTFIGSSEANGNTFDELGLFTGDPSNLANSDVFLVNHATFSAITKDNTKTVTFDVTLTFSDT